ncbi:hydrolase 1, exosortase A system-associated [Sphingomonas panni]
MRRLVNFPCMGETLAGTLDDAPGTTGLLIVSGGNELRIGAHRGQALLAAAIAAAGYPVLRFDRRGIGDSDRLQRRLPFQRTRYRRRRRRLARTHRYHADGCVRQLRRRDRTGAVPWTGTHRPPRPRKPLDRRAFGRSAAPAAIRATYAARLSSPAEWERLLTGGVNFRRLARGLATLAKRRPTQTELAGSFTAALSSGTPTDILLATRDHTAVAFLDAWHLRHLTALHHRDSDSHSFARPGDADWLRDRLLDALSRD